MPGRLDYEPVQCNENTWGNDAQKIASDCRKTYVNGSVERSLTLDGEDLTYQCWKN